MKFLAAPAFRLLKRIGIKPAARPIHSTHEPVVAKLIALLRSNQYAKADKTLSRLTPDHYSHALYNLVRADGEARLFERWCRRTSSQHALSVVGLSMVDRAWQARGGYYEQKIEDGTEETFYEKLQQAERILQQAHQIDSKNPEPLGMLLISGIGLELPQDKLVQRFEAIRALDPWHYRAHTNLMKSLKPRWNKWNRDGQEMFDFARSILAAAPDGDGIHTLIVLAHFEKYNQMLRWKGPGLREYFSSVAVKGEILEAYYRSLGSSQHVKSAFTNEQRNWFCAALHLCDAKSETQQEISQMRNRYTIYPWRTLSKSPWEKYDHGWVVDRVRREVGSLDHGVQNTPSQ